MWSGHRVLTKDDIIDFFLVMTTSTVGFSKVIHFQRYSLFISSDSEKYKFFSHSDNNNVMVAGMTMVCTGGHRDAVRPDKCGMWLVTKCGWSPSSLLSNTHHTK